MPSRPQKKVAAELAALAASPDAANAEAGSALLREALTSRDPRLIVQAAELIGKHGVRGYESQLAEAYGVLSDARALQDPGCHAKEAILVALEALDSSDAELFAGAAVYTQHEHVKSHERETGARVRARGLIGLARLGHGDFLSIAGAALGDREPSLRLAAAQAIAHRGQRDGAGLLLLRLYAGDDVPEIASECLRSALALAPEHALRYATGVLRGGGPTQREHILAALGSANDERAIELLAAELERSVLGPDRAAVIEALGLSRRASARELLLSLLREGSPSDASAALQALAIHRYDARLREQLAEATAHSRELARKYRELVGD